MFDCGLFTHNLKGQSLARADRHYNQFWFVAVAKKTWPFSFVVVTRPLRTQERREMSKMSKKVSSSAKRNQIGPKLDIKLNWAPLMVNKD